METTEQIYCADCDHTGYLHADDGYRPCQCRVTHDKLEGLAAAGVPRQFRNPSLETLKARFPAQQRTIDALKAYVRDWHRDSDQGLLIHGSPGAGKSLLTAALVCDIVRQHGPSVKWLNAAAVMHDFRDSVRNDAIDSGAIIRKSRKAAILVLDDLCSEDRDELTSHTIDQLYLLVNGRYDDATPLIVNTNLLPADLEKRVKPRVYSRLCGMCKFVLCAGPDQRQKQ